MGGGGERGVLHRPSLSLSLRAPCIHPRLELGFYLRSSLAISRRLGRLEVGAAGARALPPQRVVEQLGLDVTGNLLQCGDIALALVFVHYLPSGSRWASWISRLRPGAAIFGSKDAPGAGYQHAGAPA